MSQSAAVKIQKMTRGFSARNRFSKYRSASLTRYSEQGEPMQPDFSIKLNDIPLLKKFSSPAIFSNLAKQLIPGIFILTINENYVEICPRCTIDKKHLFDGDEYILLKMFITYQLVNSGILPFLREIPLTPESAIELDFSIFPGYNPTALEFHNDSNFFNILRYETSDNRPVLSSEILFIDQRFALSHANMGTRMSDTENVVLESDGKYDMTYAGELLSITQNQILEMYDTTRLKPVTMRGLYNSGDTLVMNDMLVKHAAFTTKNNSTIRLQHLELEYDETTTKEIQVTLCKKKINPTVRDLINREVLHIAIHKIKLSSTSPYKCLESHAFRVPIELQPSNDLNFDINDYSNFLKTLELHNNKCGSFKIYKQFFHNRGGYKRSKSKKKGYSHK